MCPVVITTVISCPAGIVINPHRNLNPSFESGGMKVISGTLGYRVQRTEIVKKLSIPIRARILRVVRVKSVTSLSGSPKRFFCNSASAFESARSRASLRLDSAARFSYTLATIPPAILRREPIPVAPRVDKSIVMNPIIPLIYIN